MASLPIPQGLSPQSADLWRELTDRHRFADFELVTFRRALQWFDRSDAVSAQAATATGREQAALLKLSMDSANTGLRFWRQLKFTDGQPARRPGRPSGDEWSPKRRLQKVG